MTTNDLFRDLLAGHSGNPATDWKKKVQAAGKEPSRIEQRRQIPAAFSVPRTSALANHQHRGTGPTPEPLRTRGRNNHYRTKG